MRCFHPHFDGFRKLSMARVAKVEVISAALNKSRIDKANAELRLLTLGARCNASVFFFMCHS